ncbi:hypothetical protein M413DRAFT_448563 [Hebeloma cylindrosporum]|uniref:SH3 domain-containing protein n=1 Tax=Hebeloma cylindrosporum TaxID=76867 RepID=A0A0C2Y8B2_HEBCY|nr:hypothetical protein M413DRAFT_448563 [Hebeloma cylindrosporum h7]
MGLEPADLARWTRFAAKGGIGKCVAQCDCVAESSDDLMFLKDDEITVLLQIPDMDNFFLGYCEGVVGRFSGFDVKFLGRLKKPVMTKRASLSASSISAKHEGKSPTPSNGEPPSPAPFPHRRESQEQRQSSSSTRRASSSSLSPSRTLERRGSGPHPAYSPPQDRNQPHPRLTSPLSHSHTPSLSSSPSATRMQEFDDERVGFGLGAMHPPPMSYSSTSTLSDSVVTTPAFAAFPPHTEAQDSETTKKTNHSFSPRTTPFPVSIESSTSTSTAGSESPTRPPSPPENSNSTNKGHHKYTSNAPAPLNLGPEAKRFFPESNTSPLRITKRIPTSPPTGTIHISPYSPPATSLTFASSSSRTNEPQSSSQSANTAHISPPASSATPNTSLSFASSSSSSYDRRSSADAQVGIGLSLLQDLANGMDSSDEDEDEEDEVRRRLRYSRWSVRSSGMGKADDDDAAAYKSALDRGGHRTQPSMESLDGTVEGLMYARSEDDEHEDITQRRTLEAPIPFTSSPQSSPSNALLSPATSPISPSFTGPNERERRPSLAASAASTGSWEGASDIYDDYRYSRFSMASKMSMSSRFSVNTGASGSGAASGVTPTPPVPESRPSMDSNSNGSRQRVDSTRSRGGELLRSRTDSTRSRPHSPHPLPQVLEADGATEDSDSDAEKEEMEMDDDGQQPLRASTKRSTVMKDRTMSMDSEASVYTQNSRLSDAVHHQLPPASSGSRPAPLNLTQQPSPLLHTSWESSSASSSAVESGFIYPASSKSSSMVYTGAVSQKQVDDAHGPPAPIPSPITPNFASSMRMKIEGGIGSPTSESGFGSNANVHGEEKTFDTTQDSSSLGNRIVVEDEDDLPSRILNSTFNDSLSSSSERTPEASRSSSPSISMHLRHVDRNLSPSPEPVIQHRLAPLIVANRTPSPSPSVAETFPSDPPSPLVPSNPPPSGSSPTPPPTQILHAPSSSSSTPRTQPASHLRPPKPNANGSSFPEQNRRRSIFQPHPNAPKSPGLVQSSQGFAPRQGEMGSSGPHPPAQQHMGQGAPPPRPHLFGVIRMALSMPPRPVPPQSQVPPRPGQPPQQQQPRGPTIYGRTEVDLGAADGPVPMIWSVDPPPVIRATAPPTNANGAQNSKASLLSSPPRVPMMMVKSGQQARSMSIGPGSMALNASAIVNGIPGDKGTGSGSNPTPGISLTRPGSVQAVPASSNLAPEQQPAQGGVIPRANFFPKAAGLRPRSRSFSGFDSMTSEVPLPKLQRGKRLVMFLYPYSFFR